MNVNKLTARETASEFAGEILECHAKIRELRRRLYEERIMRERAERKMEEVLLENKAIARILEGQR